MFWHPPQGISATGSTLKAPLKLEQVLQWGSA